MDTLYREDHTAIRHYLRHQEPDGKPVSLTRKEFELLALLVGNAGQVVPRETLLGRIWGYGAGIRTRTLDVHIRRLRLKLAPDAQRNIETIFGVGYRFQPSR